MNKTTLFTLDSKKTITAYAGIAKVAPDGTPFCTREELRHVCERMSMADLVAIWNGLVATINATRSAGDDELRPVQRFMNRAAGVERIWLACQDLTPIAAEKTKAALEAAAAPAGDSKKEQVLAMLRRPNGATGAELQAAMGWQPHTVRGFIAGTVRGKMGLHVTSAREGETTRYQVEA